MNPPFSITIEITEATQCHSAVSQLLRVFPSLSITITANETIPASARAPQTDNHYLDTNSGGVSKYCPCVVCAHARANARITAVQKAGRVDSDSDAKRAWTETRLAAVVALEAHDAALAAARCATPAGDPAPSYAWKPGEHTEAAADARLEADDRGDNKSNEADVDDSSYQ